VVQNLHRHLHMWDSTERENSVREGHVSNNLSPLQTPGTGIPDRLLGTLGPTACTGLMPTGHLTRRAPASPGPGRAAAAAYQNTTTPHVSLKLLLV